MRIFLYLTTQFVTTSSYLQDGISVISSHPTTMLNLLGKEWIDPSHKVTKYSQIQPAPSDGTMPLAANKWYMFQYELAYDPAIASLPYNMIQMGWYLNYCNVSMIKIEGNETSKIKGVIGVESTGSDIISKLKATGKHTGEAILTGIGSSVLDNNIIDESTGANTMGLRNSLFKWLRENVRNATSGAVNQISNFS